MTSKAIEIENLSKSFTLGLRPKRVLALCGLELSVEAGEVFGFLGPNGAGKTTTIKILMGLLRADSGEARIFGQSIKTPKSRKRLCYLPEIPDFYDYLTPWEFLNHLGNLSRMEHSALSKKIPEVLEKVGLSAHKEKQLRRFSKGMLQRVGIAQALLADPDLYILDEPMGGLDPLGRRWLKDLILDLRQAGKTVFFSSHVLSEAQAVCNQVAFVRSGKLLAQGSLDALLHRHVNAWEILVAGEKAQQDDALKRPGITVKAAGPDTLIVTEQACEPNRTTSWLLSNHYTLRSVTPQQASLEDVFIRAIQSAQPETER